jgi:hypothetical protein
MSKIRTASDLQDVLDRDFSWRLKEISDLKSSLRSFDSTRTKTFLRGGVALLYAHWEGFIKYASQSYLEFVANQGLRYQELKICFVVFGFKKELNLLASSKRHAQNTKTIEFLLSQMGNIARLSYKGVIDAESNLNSIVFQNIAESIGIDVAPYETKFNLIDESLLNRRNRIAHGEYLNLDENDYFKLSDEIIGLIRRYKTDIENSLALKAYKA